MPTETFHTPGVPHCYARQRRPLLLACVLGSLTLHWVVIAVLPGFMRESRPLPARELSVVLIKAEPPQPAPMAPAQTKHDLQTPKRERAASLPKKEQILHSRMPEQPQTVLSLPRPGAEPSLAFPAQALELRSSAPDPTPPAAVGPSKAPVPAAAGAPKAAPPVFDARYLRNPPPVYPLLARRNGEQGTVTLKVLVTRDGAPASVSVERSSGSAHLDRAALDTVKTWRFVPAREGSEPVEAWVLVPIVFRLEGAS